MICSLPCRNFVVRVVLVVALVILSYIRSDGVYVHPLPPQPCHTALHTPALGFLGFLTWNLCTFAFALRAKCAGSHVLSQTWSVSFYLTRYWRRPSWTQLSTTASTSHLSSQLGSRSFPANIGETCRSPQNGSNRATLKTL